MFLRIFFLIFDFYSNDINLTFADANAFMPKH